MSRTLVILGRELRSFFLSPMAYVLAFLFVVLRAIDTSFLVSSAAAGRLDMDLFPLHYTTATNGLLFMGVLVPPLLTMRLFAEERRSGSMELLMTTPVSDTEVVMGKWLASLVFYLVLWVPSLALLLLLQGEGFLDQAMPAGAVFTSHLWILLLGGLPLASGIFFSSLTTNQLVASLIGIVANLLLLFGPLLLDRLGKAPKEGLRLEVFRQCYILEHVSGGFGRGLVDSAPVGFYLSLTAVFLFLTIRSVEARKWV